MSGISFHKCFSRLMGGLQISLPRPHFINDSPAAQRPHLLISFLTLYAYIMLH